MLEVVTERGRRQFGGRSAMDISHWSQRRLSRGAAVELPRKSFRERQRVQKRELREHVVRVLMVDEGLTMVRLAGLKQVREARVRGGQGFGGEHLTKQNRA